MRNLIIICLVCLGLVACNSKIPPDGKYIRTNFDGVDSKIVINDSNYLLLVMHEGEYIEIDGKIINSGTVIVNEQQYSEIQLHRNSDGKVELLLYNPDTCVMFAKGSEEITFTNAECN